MQRNSDINVVFMPVTQHSFCSPRASSHFKSHYSQNTFCEAPAATDSDSADGSGQSQWRTFWGELTILGATRDIRDSWEEVAASAFTGVCKKFIGAAVDDLLQGLRTSVEKVSADVVEAA